MAEPVVDPRGVFVPLAERVSNDLGAPIAMGDRTVRVDAAHVSGEASQRPSGRLAVLLQQFETELDERAAALDEKAAQLEADQLAWRQQQAQQREEQRRAEFDLQERQSALASREAELAAREQSLVAASSELNSERAQLRGRVLEELSGERDELVTFRSELEAQAEALAAEAQRLAGEEARVQERIELQLQADRQALWEQLTQEWEVRRTVFENERATWDAECDEQRRLIGAERERYATLVAEWEQERSRRLAELAEELDRRRAESDAEQAARFDAERNAIAAERTEFQRERVLLENRLRFQQEHLEKVRSDLERAQNDFRAERQRERQQIEDALQQQHRREAQLSAYRRTLDELSRSIDREHETILKCREAWASNVGVDRQSLDDERRTWEDDRRRQEVELRRQQELIREQAERLETKRLRLERLRAELEDTHRTTLELRLAVEEAWAQIAHSLGSDEDARVKVEQARQALVLYYQQLHAALEDHRREVSEQQAWFDQQRLEFHEERQTVLHWLNERDERLRAEEARQLTAAAELAAHDAAWRSTRDRWLSEKLEAERVIRRLVNELAGHTLDGAASTAVESVLRAA